MWQLVRSLVTSSLVVLSSIPRVAKLKNSSNFLGKSIKITMWPLRGGEMDHTWDKQKYVVIYLYAPTLSSVMKLWSCHIDICLTARKSRSCAEKQLSGLFSPQNYDKAWAKIFLIHLQLNVYLITTVLNYSLLVFVAFVGNWNNREHPHRDPVYTVKPGNRGD